MPQQDAPGVPFWFGLGLLWFALVEPPLGHLEPPLALASRKQNYRLDGVALTCVFNDIVLCQAAGDVQRSMPFLCILFPRSESLSSSPALNLSGAAAQTMLDELREDAIATIRRAGQFDIEP